MLYRSTILLILFTGICSFVSCQNISHHCVPFINIVWNRRCSGKVTRELKLKYKDRRIDVGTKFTIYTTVHRNMGVFLTFHSSEVSECEHIVYNYFKKFLCQISSGSNSTTTKPLNLAFSNCYCYDFFLGYVSEFVGLCSLQKDVYFGNINLKYSVIHYTRPRMSHSPNYRCNSVLITTEILALCIFKWLFKIFNKEF